MMTAVIPGMEQPRIGPSDLARVQLLLREKYDEAGRLRVFLTAALPEEQDLLRRRLDGCLREIQDLEYFADFGVFR